ncbi:MAG: hypothetical protein L6Q97_18960 [Thermoanaerobaculia bacterium]|nr:hypothetical protein [Thermoanaerobaculia bacterium]
MLRIGALLFWMIGACASWGQPVRLIWDKDSTFMDTAGNTWQRRQLTVIQPAGAAPERLFPWGEISTRRLGFTERQFTFPAHRDTIAVTVTNKEGIPFKAVEWQVDPVVNGFAKNSAVFEELLSRRPDSLKVAAATVNNLWPRDLDSLFRTAQINNMVCEYVSGPGQKMTLTAWKLKAPLKEKGKSIIQTGALKTIRRPATATRLLPSGPHLLPRLGKTRSIPYTGFQPGDTLQFLADAPESPLKEIYLTDDAGNVRNRLTNAIRFADTIVVKTEKTLTLHLRGKAGLKKKLASVSVLRIRPVRSDSFYVVSDSLFESKTTTVADTLLFTVVDDSLQISPVWNIESVPYGSLEVQIPRMAADGYTLMHAAYWVGIGRDCLNDYQAFEATVPADWSKPGAPPAMGAFALKRPLFLPATGVNEVHCAFSATPETIFINTAKKPLPPSLARLPQGKNAGLLSPDYLGKRAVRGISRTTSTPSYNFYACFQNISTVNTWPVALKVVGVYRKETVTPAGTEFLQEKTYQKPLAK